MREERASLQGRLCAPLACARAQPAQGALSFSFACPTIQPLASYVRSNSSSPTLESLCAKLSSLQSVKVSSAFAGIASPYPAQPSTSRHASPSVGGSPSRPPTLRTYVSHPHTPTFVIQEEASSRSDLINYLQTHPCFSAPTVLLLAPHARTHTRTHARSFTHACASCASLSSYICAAHLACVLPHHDGRSRVHTWRYAWRANSAYGVHVTRNLLAAT